MTDNVFQFRERVRPFSDVFDQLSLKCAAIRIEGKWISIYTCLTLDNSLDASAFESRVVKAGSEFIALFVSYPSDAFETVLEGMESGKIELTVQGEHYEIFLNRVAAGMKSQSVTSPNLQFGNSWRPLREYAQNKMAYRPSIELNTLGDRFHEVISQDDNERISKQFRMHQPRYNGLDGLLQFMGSRNRPNSSGDQALVEVKALLPFDMTVQEDQVLIKCPENLASKLAVLFFFSPHESMTVLYSEDSVIASDSPWRTASFRVQWPSMASQGEAHIHYNGEEVERTIIRHWASGANWRVSVDSYFDPETRFLKEALRGGGQRHKGEKRSQAFEQGIVRLLTLAGIPVTWHGDIRQAERPDLAGYCELSGRRIALIGECTLEKPVAKLDAVKSRAAVVLQLLGNSAEVLPVVFTACDPIQSDYGNAAKEGIALIGRNEIAHLLQLVERNAGVSAIIKQIENSRTIHDFSDIARWSDRYS